MTSLQRRASEVLLAIGVVFYGTWQYYNQTLTLCFIGAFVLAGVGLFNVVSDGDLWERTDAGRRRETRLVAYSLALLLLAVFFKSTGRQTLGMIGAQLIVFVGLIVILLYMVGGGGKKKKDS